MKAHFNDYGNKQVSLLPIHLQQFVVAQNYVNYTAQDHAVWRYVMRKNLSYLKTVADKSYLLGLEKTGITIDTIPNIKDMNNILGKIGWGCVCVDGFLPPASFMEFQAYKVLVIAADIRQIEHIEYTPAPDILHEAAGHAPIIADSNYAQYLKLFGEIGSKAISSSKDFELYEAIRHLSIIKENPNTDPSDIEHAEQVIDHIQKNMGEPSEMTRIRNLHWWTVEYGLIGSLNHPKIYGAGLLSSIGESKSCMKDEVLKIPYTIDAANQSFDITEPQPQLYVTPNYSHLTDVLEQFANTMALRKGGLYGLQKAIDSKNICTAQYSSGLQVSAIFNNFIQDQNHQLIYLSTSSPTELAFSNKVLKGHQKNYHNHGFSSPVGKLKDQTVPLEKMSENQLVHLGLIKNNSAIIEFESGIKVNGTLKEITTINTMNLIFTFENCTVTYKDKMLFQPEWGVYDMAVGQSITSVYSGVADKSAYSKENPFVPKEKTHKIEYSAQRLKLHKIYQNVREVREGLLDQSELKENWENLQQFDTDWLCALEMYEICKDVNLKKDIKDFLEHSINNHPSKANLISDGLKLLV